MNVYIHTVFSVDVLFALIAELICIKEKVYENYLSKKHEVRACMPVGLSLIGCRKGLTRKAGTVGPVEGMVVTVQTLPVGIVG
jgi:hypothetical protein